MAIEKFANLAQTTLVSEINDSVTSLTVTDASQFPSSGDFRILIDDELITVVTVTDDVFSDLIRECETGSSTASTHAAGALVTHVRTVESLTASVLQNYSRDIVFGIVGTFEYQLTSPLCNPVQITKVSTFSPVETSVCAKVLTLPTGSATVFKICKNALQYHPNYLVASFSVETNGTISIAFGIDPANFSFIVGDYLTIFCTGVGSTTHGADGIFTITV